MVNISRNMAVFTFVILSLTYDAAEPLDVAMIVTMLAAIAYLTGTPNATRSGIMILPPPKPVSAPRNPAGTEIRNNSNKSTMIHFPLTTLLLATTLMRR
jgi:hypothetical protein